LVSLTYKSAGVVDGYSFEIVKDQFKANINVLRLEDNTCLVEIDREEKDIEIIKLKKLNKNTKRAIHRSLTVKLNKLEIIT